VSAVHPPALVGDFTLAPEPRDLDGMTARLRPFLSDRRDLRLVAMEVLSRSPGKRWVVRYRVALPTDSRPLPDLIAKLFVAGDRAARSHHTLELLYPRCTETWRVPQPIAQLPELRMSVREAARGRRLDQLTGEPRRAAVIGAAGWLATLHRLDLDLERRLSIESESRKVLEWAAVIAERHAAAASRAERLAAQLASRARSITLSASVPIHKDFHYQHVFVDGGAVTVIDLDELRIGDPALDVAHFCANLFLLAAREASPGRAAESLASVFRAAYAEAKSDIPIERYDFFYAYTCLKIAKQLARGRGPAPVPSGGELARQLSMALDEGLRCATA
jgi:hypothetical protein